MNFALPPLSSLVTPLAWLCGAFLVWRWLRRDLTPARVLSIWETEGVLSGRQLLAWVVALFALFMLAAARITAAECQELLFVSFGLFGIGGVVRAVDKYKPTPATVNANNLNAKVDAQEVHVGAAASAAASLKALEPGEPDVTQAGYPPPSTPQGPLTGLRPPAPRPEFNMSDYLNQSATP